MLPTRRVYRIATVTLTAAATGCSIPLEASQQSPRARAHAEQDARRGVITMAIAPGEFAIDRPGPDTDPDARTVRFSAEFGRSAGGGVRIERTTSDDDEFGTSVDRINFYGHFSGRFPAGPRGHVGVRVGPQIDVTDFDTSPGSSDYTTFAARFEVEPEFDLFRRDRTALSAFFTGHIGAGAAYVDVESGGVDDSFDTDAVLYGFETGLRFRAARFFGGASYLWSRTDVDESDSALTNAAMPATTYGFRGVAFTMGVVW